LTASRSGSTGKGHQHKRKSAAEGLSVSETAPRRPRSETEAVPVRLRFREDGPGKVTDHHDPDGSGVVVELPLSAVTRFLSKRLALELCHFIRNCQACLERSPFPCPLAEVRQNSGLLAALRVRLPFIDNLASLITDPPAILLDERQRLCFFKGFPIALCSSSFRSLLLRALSPGQFVTRTAIYNHFWQGAMDDEERPYERQISDHKYRLTAEIKRGMAARQPLGPCEIEGMFSTQYKQGYRLNLVQEDILVFTRKDLLVFAFLFLLRKWFDGCTGWLPIWRCLGSIGIWPGSFSL
jgi:hypothetical protein